MTCGPAPTANSVSVAVGERLTIRCGASGSTGSVVASAAEFAAELAGAAVVVTSAGSVADVGGTTPPLVAGTVAAALVSGTD
jgi:hypothetical protein